MSATLSWCSRCIQGQNLLCFNQSYCIVTAFSMKTTSSLLWSVSLTMSASSSEYTTKKSSSYLGKGRSIHWKKKKNKAFTGDLYLFIYWWTLKCQVAFRNLWVFFPVFVTTDWILIVVNISAWVNLKKSPGRTHWEKIGSRLIVLHFHFMFFDSISRGLLFTVCWFCGLHKPFLS